VAKESQGLKCLTATSSQATWLEETAAHARASRDNNEQCDCPANSTALAATASKHQLEVPCTKQESDRQNVQACDHWRLRHNLKPLFVLLRWHLPNAKTFVDIGANKGLVSARWLELWKPELGVYPKRYVEQSLVPFLDARNLTNTIAVCGVTDMCDPINLVEHQMIQQASPIRGGQEPNERPFVTHSIEPSAYLYDMHVELRNKTSSDPRVTNPDLAKYWKLHKLASAGTYRRHFICDYWIAYLIFVCFFYNTLALYYSFACLCVHTSLSAITVPYKQTKMVKCI